MVDHRLAVVANLTHLRFNGKIIKNHVFCAGFSTAKIGQQHFCSAAIETRPIKLSALAVNLYCSTTERKIYDKVLTKLNHFWHNQPQQIYFMFLTIIGIASLSQLNGSLRDVYFAQPLSVLQNKLKGSGNTRTNIVKHNCVSSEADKKTIDNCETSEGYFSSNILQK